MNLIAQQILMNWIGMVAALFDRFSIYGSAEKRAEAQQLGRTPNQYLDQKLKIQP